MNSAFGKHDVNMDYFLVFNQTRNIDVHKSINKTIFHENNISVKCPNSQSLRARSPQTFRQKIRRRVNRNRIWG